MAMASINRNFCVIFSIVVYLLYVSNGNYVGEYANKFFANDTESGLANVVALRSIGDEVMGNWAESKSGVMFSGVFTNNSVLQREPEYAALYGTSDTPNTWIILVIKDVNTDSTHNYSTISMENGDWKIVLAETYANGGNYTLTIYCNQCISDPRHSTIHNITFGDVYLCLGQSNMALEVEFTFNARYTYANITELGKYSNIRFYNKRKMATHDNILPFVIPAENGRNNHKYEWHFSSNIERVSRFSATCWYTAQSLVDMYKMSHINFGLIVSAVGGSQIESWIMNKTIETSVCGETNNDCPGEECGALYNGMVLPFTNMTIKGIIWYQGENNVRQQMRNYSAVSPYSCLEKLMIDKYRSVWNKKYLPFGIVELAGGTSEGHPKAMPYFRHAQSGNYGILPNKQMINVFMAQAYDIGDPGHSMKYHAYDLNTTNWFGGPIHARPKLYVGQRMAMNINKFIYNNNQIWKGPLLKGCDLDRNDKIITINFNENMLFDEKVIVQPFNLWYNESLAQTVKYWSTIKLFINQSIWRDLIGMNVFSVDSNGYTVNINISSMLENDVTSIDGISYAWSDYPCCGDLDRKQHPCPMNMCPIITSKSRLPAVPFQAKIVDNKCQCFEPQKCDGSEYVLPEISTKAPTNNDIYLEIDIGFDNITLFALFLVASCVLFNGTLICYYCFSNRQK